MATSVALGISLETDCAWETCRQFSLPLLEQMDSGQYDLMSVLSIPVTIGEWTAAHRTARKRANRARARGYYGGILASRIGSEDDVFEINTSAAHRQGRPMSAGYLKRPSFAGDPDYPCPRHGVHYYDVRLPKDGVMGAGKMVGYLWVYRAGDLALVSSILGHADYLDDEIMFPLFEAALMGEIRVGPGFMVYNRHDSGTRGLVQWKEWQGFEEREVEWLP